MLHSLVSLRIPGLFLRKKLESTYRARYSVVVLVECFGERFNQRDVGSNLSGTGHCCFVPLENLVAAGPELGKSLPS